MKKSSRLKPTTTMAARAKTVKASPTEIVKAPSFFKDSIQFMEIGSVDWVPDKFKKSKKIVVAVVMITPKIAEKMLHLNIKNNRRLSDKDVQSYADQMKATSWWWQALSPIRFSDRCMLLDGQHRLHAIIRSGVTLPSLVVYNVPTDAVRGIDAGKKRSIAQQITLQGRPTLDEEVTIARFMMSPWTNIKSKFDTPQVEAFLKDFGFAVQFAMDRLPRFGERSVKKLVSAAVQTPVAKAYSYAYLSGDKKIQNKITDFCRELMECGKMIEAGSGNLAGISDHAYRLAIFLMATGKRADSKSEEKYRKTMWVLRRYLDGENFERINEASEDYWPIRELYS